MHYGLPSSARASCPVPPPRLAASASAAAASASPSRRCTSTSTCPQLNPISTSSSNTNFGESSGQSTVTNFVPGRIFSAAFDSRRMVASSQVTQLQNTKSAACHCFRKFGWKKSPTFVSISINGARAGLPPGKTSRVKSPTSTSAIAPTHGKISIPNANEKCLHNPATKTPFPVPLPRSKKTLPSLPFSLASADTSPCLSRSSTKSLRAISPYTNTSSSSSEVPASDSNTISFATSGRTCSRSTSSLSIALGC
mmetsp:Transcript_4603/g.17051  ORF Transcript_4603/g.17051 Transcript_4603/m.17051 type:complete len:253 (+) Transcript_4603:896-1654(+)